MSVSQFNYLFTLKNAHFSLNSYNFWMQPNIEMKLAGYVAWILLCKRCKFGGKIYYNSRDIEFFLGGLLFWRTLYNDVDDTLDCSPDVEQSAEHSEDIFRWYSSTEAACEQLWLHLRFWVFLYLCFTQFWLLLFVTYYLNFVHMGFCPTWSDLVGPISGAFVRGPFCSGLCPESLMTDSCAQFLLMWLLWCECCRRLQMIRDTVAAALRSHHIGFLCSAHSTQLNRTYSL